MSSSGCRSSKSAADHFSESAALIWSFNSSSVGHAGGIMAAVLGRGDGDEVASNAGVLLAYLTFTDLRILTHFPRVCVAQGSCTTNFSS